jgi:hypothetical protein
MADDVVPVRCARAPASVLKYHTYQNCAASRARIGPPGLTVSCTE